MIRKNKKILKACEEGFKEIERLESKIWKNKSSFRNLDSDIKDFVEYRKEKEQQKPKLIGHSQENEEEKNKKKSGIRGRLSNSNDTNNYESNNFKSTDIEVMANNMETIIKNMLTIENNLREEKKYFRDLKQRISNSKEAVGGIILSLVMNIIVVPIAIIVSLLFYLAGPIIIIGIILIFFPPLEQFRDFLDNCRDIRRRPKWWDIKKVRDRLTGLESYRKLIIEADFEGEKLEQNFLEKHGEELNQYKNDKLTEIAVPEGIINETIEGEQELLVLEDQTV